MNALAWFWAVWLIISGVSFALITVLVAIRGFGDLRRMFSLLRDQRGEE